MCSSTVSSSLTLHVFRWRKLPLMFNSCHVTRLRRTSLRLLLFLFLRLHRGRCHELYKHVPPSRGKAFGTVVALEFGGDLRGEDRRKQTFVTLSLLLCMFLNCFGHGVILNNNNNNKTGPIFSRGNAQRTAMINSTTPLVLERQKSRFTLFLERFHERKLLFIFGRTARCTYPLFCSPQRRRDSIPLPLAH